MSLSKRCWKKMRSSVVRNENPLVFPCSSSYETAMQALSSLISGPKRGIKPTVGGKYEKLDRVLMYLKILGLQDEHLSALNIIHVAGLKGRYWLPTAPLKFFFSWSSHGSTCAFCEAILRECGLRTGLFTSPHLIDVRERFHINGLDISENKFLEHFWDCWNQLKENISEDLPMPPLFQFLTVLAFKIFVSEKVDVAIVEVGLGGTRDSTNVIKEPVVCGVSSLGMDHMEVLGDTLRDIASHKAGIFKPRTPAFTVPQLPEAMDVLQTRAHELMVPLEITPPLGNKKLDGLKLSLAGDHQFINAGLAVSLCKCWLQSTGNWDKLFPKEADLPDAFLRGLATACLPGRAQIVHDTPHSPHNVFQATKSSGDLVFYLDGAHSPESMDACARWFSDVVKENKNPSSSLLLSSSSFKVQKRRQAWENGFNQCENVKILGSQKIAKQILLFNCMEIRDPQVLLPRLVGTCASSGTHFSKALFVPGMSTYSKVTSGASVVSLDIPNKDLSWQFNLQRIWEKIILRKDLTLEKASRTDNPEVLPPHEFLYEDSSSSTYTDRCFTCSAVIPSLPLTVKWLRDCVKENPSLRVQVLVTGSLHLVGDVLKLLRR
ncbi:hypothetical protein RJ641_026322 [Dillenia turbinata]|uniref:Folylpolyglutamate synthase n=1 Tax=Dillenia turbinata TaxID=194707 RepID=A0AAN8W4J4_9MAGN